MNNETESSPPDAARAPTDLRDAADEVIDFLDMDIWANHAALEGAVKQLKHARIMELRRERIGDSTRRNDVLEEAAKACEGDVPNDDCAALIRSLKCRAARVVPEISQQTSYQEIPNTSFDNSTERSDRGVQAPAVGAPMPLAEKIANNVWDHINDVVPTLKAAMAGEWHWYENPACKHIELRIDMRDGGCILKDRHGERISVEQLQYQQSKASV